MCHLIFIVHCKHSQQMIMGFCSLSICVSWFFVRKSLARFFFCFQSIYRLFFTHVYYDWDGAGDINPLCAMKISGNMWNAHQNLIIISSLHHLINSKQKNACKLIWISPLCVWNRMIKWQRQSPLNICGKSNEVTSKAVAMKQRACKVTHNCYVLFTYTCTFIY